MRISVVRRLTSHSNFRLAGCDFEISVTAMYMPHPRRGPTVRPSVLMAIIIIEDLIG